MDLRVMQGILLKIDAFHNIQMGTAYRSVSVTDCELLLYVNICNRWWFAVIEGFETLGNWYSLSVRRNTQLLG